MQNNIEHFGGNPTKVTIFGHSAGGASVGVHLFSPLRQNLYANAIMQSGSPIAYWASLIQNDATLRAEMLATALGCDPDGDTVECLKTSAPEHIVEKQHQLTGYDWLTFRPVIDGYFLTEHPKMSLANGNFKKCPILQGVTKNEGSIFFTQLLPDYLNMTDSTMTGEQFVDSMDRLFGHYPTYHDGISDAGKDALLYEYTNWEDKEDKYANIAQLDFAYADLLFVCPSQIMADVYTAVGESVYFYEFTDNFESYPVPDWVGVPHGHDVFFMLGAPYFYPEYFTEEETVLSYEMMKHWSNFAKTG